MIIVQSSMFEGLGYLYSTNVKGVVRAYDIRTGKQLWRFDPMPGPGQKYHDTWENGSWSWTGNTGVWTHMTADTEAGLLYLPVETPTIDEYGGNRPRRQPVRREHRRRRSEDRRLQVALPVRASPAVGSRHVVARLLIDTDVEGKPRKLIAVPSKQGWLYMLRSHHRPADLADAEDAGSANRHAA